MDIGFTKSKINECVFYRESVMYIIFTDDSIIAGLNQEYLEALVVNMKK